MNRERVVKIIQEWLPMTHRTVYELADRIIAEEGKDSPFIEPTNAGDPFPYRKSRATSKFKKQPQQPKAEEGKEQPKLSTEREEWIRYVNEKLDTIFDLRLTVKKLKKELENKKPLPTLEELERVIHSNWIVEKIDDIPDKGVDWIVIHTPGVFRVRIDTVATAILDLLKGEK